MFNKDLNENQDEFISKSMEKDPLKRYQNADIMIRHNGRRLPC